MIERAHLERFKLPLALLAVGGAVVNATAAKQPNVILILADDYSCGEHGFYGNDIIRTPNIDRLATESVWFDNFYVGATSSPTRAQLLSGRHEFRCGITHTKYPRAYMRLDEKLLPEYFVEQGYATAHFGKWHLGNDVFDDEYSARARGFQHSIVSDYREHFDPVMINDGEYVAYKGFREDILFDEAEAWMNSQRKVENPFFCYIATNSAHSPYGCPEEYRAHYTGKVKGYGDTYYGMVENVDKNVGELIEWLKQSGEYENTLLIYLPDNGHTFGGYNAGMRGNKNSEYRGGSRVPCLMHYPERFEGGRKIGELAGGIDLLPTLSELLGFKVGKAVDGVSLVPLLEGKKSELKERYLVTHTGRWVDGELSESKHKKYAVQSRQYRLVNNTELYDIEQDPSETTNIIDKEPKLVAKMRKFYDKWWAESLPEMVNDELSLKQGGSRLSIEDVAFRELQRKQEFRYPLVLDMVHHNPGEATYISQYNNPAMMSSMGYNGKVYFLFESPMLAINWESVDKNILPTGTPDREWVDKKAAEIRAMQAACTQAGLLTLAQSDLVLLPKRLIEQRQLDERMGEPRDAEIERLIRAQVGEMFDQFPLLDGLVTRIGETYLHDAPYHIGKINEKNSPEKTIIPLLEILRDEICVKRGKLLIYRGWESFDRKVADYMAVSSGVEPHQNLVLSIKHCEGDFHRANPFSAVIGMGRHRQIIEVQCAREYEGKGAYPNYIANGVIEGFEEHRSMPSERLSSIRDFAVKHPDMYAGIWTWTRGGGWEGPYIKDELWCDLNAWVMAQWAADPSQREEAIFSRYAAERLQLKGGDLAKFRRLCLLSADAVIRGKNTTEGDINPWWSRDEGIGWAIFTKGADLDRVVAQKAEAVAIWREIVKLAEQIEWGDEQLREQVIGSCYYGLHLYEIYQAVISARVAELRNDRVAIQSAIELYDAAWERYNALPKRFSSLATLYTKEYRQRYQKTHAESEIERLRKIKP
ncbi:MAG: arylsulfatase [Rikenellaceae bacterium]